MKKPFLLSRKGIVSSRSPSPSSPFSVQRSLASVSPGAQLLQQIVSVFLPSSMDEWTDSHPTELVLKGFISSRRFFFSPCTTKSIMEEAHIPLKEENKMGLQEAAMSTRRGKIAEKQEDDDVVAVLFVQKERNFLSLFSLLQQNKAQML
ncbi:hypothetical protein AAC387_Pa12g0650 [Persea americana]